MKKILTAVFLLINISLFAQDTIPATDTFAIKIEVPKFSDPQVQNVAQEYASIIKESIGMMKNPSMDSTKEQEFAKRAEALGTKMQEAIKLLESTPDEMKKFTDFLQAAAQNMAKAYTPSEETNAENKPNVAPVGEPSKPASKKTTNKKPAAKKTNKN